MEEAYWKQFMSTGKVEDYLQFKQVCSMQINAQKEEKQGRFEGVKPDAGIGKCNSHCT